MSDRNDSQLMSDVTETRPAALRKAQYEQLRRMSTWRLLSGSKAPAVIAILQSVFPAGNRRLPRSELMARVEVHLDLLHDEGREQQTSAGDYCDTWVREGYLTRRDDPNFLETTYEPSAATIEALEFITSLEDRRPTTTQSRLQLVMQQFERLAQETEGNLNQRLLDLQAERERIEAEIERLSTGELHLPPAEASLDRLRDILQIADELSSDFLQYREDLRAVDLHLREQILSPEGARGEVLEKLLAGDDLLGQSNVGRTFTAFFRMLNDPLQNQRAQEVVDRLLARDFARELSSEERDRLANVFASLYEPAQEVLDVKTELYRSLARFVRSQDFRQHQVLADLLQRAQHVALSQKDSVSARAPFDYQLDQSRVLLRSIAQYQLKDPSDGGIPEEVQVVDTTTLSVEVLDDLVRTNDIDLRELTRNVSDVVGKNGQASIYDVLRAHPASQGLASVIGLMFLATQFAQPRPGATEEITWQEMNGQTYRAKVPTFFFLEAPTEPDRL